MQLRFGIVVLLICLLSVASAFPTGFGSLLSRRSGPLFVAPFTPSFSTGSKPAESPDDCKLAHRLNLRPKVDCLYTWETWLKGHEFNYVIRIDPSGQNSVGWWQGIWDNIKRECGRRADCTVWDWTSRHDCYDGPRWNPREVNGTWYYGVEATYRFHKRGKDTDASTADCVKRAIEKASCGIELDFVNGTCYKRPHSPHP
ncbi:hypothetical protein KJ359_002429 [Pestalotiopsis sp. 9143b]|nr:hypothetical protein KJ359_002429 [Pestalotiopsis sp. 9143b]